MALAHSKSSKVTSAISSGMRRWACFRASSAPIVIALLPLKIAVGGCRSRSMR